MAILLRVEIPALPTRLARVSAVLVKLMDLRKELPITLCLLEAVKFSLLTKLKNKTIRITITTRPRV